MKKQDLWDVFGEIDADLILDAEPKAGTVAPMTARKKRFKPLIFVIAATMIIMAMSVTAMAVYTAKNEMEPYWSTLFKPTEGSFGQAENAADAEQLKAISYVPDDIVYTETDPNVSLRIVGLSGGSKHLYIWFEVALSRELMAQMGGTPEKISLYMDYLHYEEGDPAEIGFDNEEIDSCNAKYLGTKAELLETHVMYLAETQGAEAASNVESEENERIFCFAAAFSTDLTLRGRRLKVRVDSVKYKLAPEAVGEAVEWQTLIEGRWVATMTLDGQQIYDTYYQYGCTVEFSPLYLSISRIYDPATGDEKMVTHPTITLIMVDGTEREVAFSGMRRSYGGGNYPGLGLLTVGGSVNFNDEPVDTSRVVALRYGGITISLNEETLVKPEEETADGFAETGAKN